jgi:hypothetical protein
MADDQRTESTQELTDSIERLTQRLDSIDRAARAGERAVYGGLRLAGAAAVATGGAVVAGQQVRRHGFAGAATRAYGTFQAGKMIRGVTGGGLLRMAGPAGFAIAGGLAIASQLKNLFGGQRGGSAGVFAENAKRQTELLGNLYRQSLRQTRSTEMLTAIAAARADPLGGTARAARARLASQGTAPTRGEAYRAALLTSARGEVGEARSAISRLLRDLLTPLRTAAALNQSAMLRGVNDTLRFRGGITGQLGRLQTLQGITSGNPFTAVRYGMNRISDLRNMQATDNTLNRGPLGGPVERALFQLQTYGPGQVGRPPASVRGGGMSEYAFRVRRQYEEFDRERIREWQDKVLLALESLVQQGKLSADELYQKQVEFSRVPRIDGVQ